MVVVSDPKLRVSIEKFHKEILFYSSISHWKNVKDITMEQRYWVKLDKGTELSFVSPDQIVFLEFMDTENGWATGIDFETALNILKPYMRKLKLKQIKNKKL